MSDRGNNEMLSLQELENGLEDPGDPYGLAEKPDYVIQYFAPMFDSYRYEFCRRARTSCNTQRQK